MVDGGERPRVLVVDDHASVRVTLSALLEEEFSVDSVGSAEAARRVLALRIYDVVVADYQLPGASGLSLLDHVEMSYPDAVGILVTGHGDHPEIRRTQAGQRFGVILKPYDEEMVVARVRQAASVARLKRVSRLSGDSRK